MRRREAEHRAVQRHLDAAPDEAGTRGAGLTEFVAELRADLIR